MTARDAPEAAAYAICARRNAPDWPCNGLDYDGEMARVAIAAYEAALWRPIAEAPRDGTVLILFWPAIGGDAQVGQPPEINVVGVGAWMCPGRGYVPHWCREFRWTPGDDPTHFRLLSPPPAGAEA